MDYQQTLDYLFSQLPVYQRIGAAAYKIDLNNTVQLCQFLDNPQNKFKSIHVAGTNGKGSTSHMIASVLQEAGYNVGLYTSPHLKDFRERIKINGAMISEEEVISFVENYKTLFEEKQLSFFEWTVGLAFYYFAHQKVDIAIIETGLGGRLDSTNVITPLLSVITNISIDHTQFLGTTIQEIAYEKAGIIKQNVPVIIGETQSEIEEVFIDKAKEKQSPIIFADQEVIQEYDSDLKGEYQIKNIKTCVATILTLNQVGWKISEENIKSGLLNSVKNTQLLGRWQILSEKPLIICDTGHNEDGIKEIVKQMGKMSYNTLHFVFGAVNDKSLDKVLSLLPKKAQYYFCQAKIPRAMDVDELIKFAKKFDLVGNRYKSVNYAIEQAKANALPNDLIFVGGSTFVVAEVV